MSKKGKNVVVEKRDIWPEHDTNVLVDHFIIKKGMEYYFCLALFSCCECLPLFFFVPFLIELAIFVTGHHYGCLQFNSYKGDQKKMLGKILLKFFK